MPKMARGVSEPAWTLITNRQNSLWLCGNGTLVRWEPVWAMRLLGFPSGAPELQMLSRELTPGDMWNCLAR